MYTLAALNYALGKELQELGGRPLVFVTQNFEPDDTTLHISTGLGLTEADGVVWVEGNELAYEERTATTLTGVNGHRTKTIPRGARVEPSTRRLVPPAYELFWPTSQLAREFYDRPLSDFLVSP